MKFITLLTLALFTLTAANATERRIYTTDKYGVRDYSKASFTVTDDGRVYETDKYGVRRSGKPSYRIEDDKIVPTDSFGNRQYGKQPPR